MAFRGAGALPPAAGRRRGNALVAALTGRWHVAISPQARPVPVDLGALLAEPGLYREEIDRLHARHLQGRGLHELQQSGVSLAVVVSRRDHLARVLSRAVSSGTYRARPARPRSIRAGGKRRTVYALELGDLVVHGVVATLLTRALEPRLNASLTSYRAGVPWWRAAHDLAAHVRAHRHRPGRPGGGVYVLRRDVDSYTDSIPLGPRSPIWDAILRALAPVDVGPTEWALLANVVRPEIAWPDGSVRPREAGIPTGLPISSVLFNLYLADIDHELAAIPGACYARYSDDIAFAHPDPRVVRDAAALIELRIRALGLSLKASKSRDVYLTTAGRASIDWPAAVGANSVTFLGLRVGADGTVGLDAAKARALVRDVRRRAEAAVASASDADEAAQLAVDVVGRALEADHASAASSSAMLLRHVVTDRRQLAELDHRIGREVASALAADRSIRALRRFPPALLRTRYGLPSLVAARNGAVPT